MDNTTIYGAARAALPARSSLGARMAIQCDLVHCMNTKAVYQTVLPHKICFKLWN